MGGGFMTLQQLEYFLSCATLLNFRKVAQLHYISPSTLTRHVSALEAELGTPLLERDTHNVYLTEVGQTFFHTAYEMLTVYQNFFDIANMAGMKLERQGNPFLIGSYAFDGMYGTLVDQILSMPDYFLDRPIHIDFISAGNMIPSVQRGDIQIGIDSEAHIKKHGDQFEMRLLQSVPFHVAVGPNHPLSRRKIITMKELFPYFDHPNAHPLDGKAFGSKLSFPIDSAEALRKLGEFTIEALPALFPVLDRKNMGDNTIIVLPRMLTAGKTNELHRIEIAGNPCGTNYMLFWRKDNKNPDIQKFIEFIS